MMTHTSYLINRCQYLRRLDRRVNVYPSLHYPELYLLLGGYKLFHASYPVQYHTTSDCLNHSVLQQLSQVSLCLRICVIPAVT